MNESEISVNKQQNFSQLLQWLKEYTVSILLVLLSPSILFLKGFLENHLSKGELSISVGVSVLFFLLCLAWCFALRSQLSEKLIARFGLYWDKRKNPYCPTCKIPLRPDGYWKFANCETFSLSCPKCRLHHPMFDENGKAYDLPSIKKLI